MIPRCYQDRLITSACDAFESGVPATLVVAATGTGKTVIFCLIAARYVTRGRVMVMAHRTELIEQAAAKLRSITGINPAIEKAEQFSEEDFLHGKPQIVVASIPTLNSGSDDLRRLHRFDPHEFSLLVCDEVHHGVSASWKRCIDHFRQNPDCKVLGVTATPDRADERGLKEIIDHVAGTYDLPDAIADGYLVPIRQRRVRIDGLEFAKIHTVAGDFDQGELEAAMMAEKPLHGVAHATIEQACGLEIGFLETIRDAADRVEKLCVRLNRQPKKTLLFSVSVSHAERLAEIINRWIPQTAEFVCGATPEKERAAIFKRFATGQTRFLSNVGVALEGFDEPSIEMVSMARPTKSRTVYAQAVGRGTRPCEDIARELGELADAESRRRHIAQSEKQFVEILDFTGASGRHKLVCAADLLGIARPQAVIDRAAELSEEQSIDAEEALNQADDEFELTALVAAELEKQQAEEIDESAERRVSAAAMRRLNVVATANYTTRTVNAFDHSQIEAPSNNPALASPRQVELLKGFGINPETAAGYSRRQASAIIDKMMQSRGTDRQRWALKKMGYVDEEIEHMNFRQCSEALNQRRASE